MVEVGSGETPAFTAAVERALDYVADLCPALEAHVGLSDGSLVVPAELRSSLDLSLVKEFCVGLLENPERHAWWPALRGCSLEARYSVAGSLFLSRKMLPCRPSSWEAHASRVCSESASGLPRGYLRFVAKICREVFPPGWDSGYEKCVSLSAPRTSASIRTARSKGGSRREWLGRRRDFITACLGLRTFRVPSSFPVRFENVELDGKSRSVTIGSSAQQLLAPLHRCLYDAVSRKDWLLRGEAKTCKFSEFVSKPGEVFVSGDYESATDYLPLEVAVEILKSARRSSREIPDLVWEYAELSLFAEIEYPDGSRRAVVRGQLMGNLLSFPLLCLQNYIAFRWVVPRGVPVRVNGDDIVFRATPEVASVWADTVSSLGLRLSRGKTLFSPSVFSVNSSFFRASRGRPRLIPVVRSAVLQRDVQVPHALGPGLRTFAKGFVGEARIRLEMVYLRCRRKQVTVCGRSLLRDLRLPVQPETLQRLGLLRREAFMLSLPPLPLPLDQVRMGGTVPEGWERVPLGKRRGDRRRQRSAQESFYGLLLDRAWSVPAIPVRSLAKATWQAARGGYQASWLSWRRKTKLRCLPSIGRSSCYRKFCSMARVGVHTVWSFDPPLPERKVWVGSGRMIPTSVAFVSAGVSSCREP
jgi:hypothetical protein